MAWELNGNANTNPNADFVGTTDSEPLIVKTHGNEALRVTVSGNIGIGTSNPTSKLEIAAQDALTMSGFQPFLTLSDTDSGKKRARIQTAHGDLAVFTENGLSSGVPQVLVKNDTGSVEIHAQDGLRIAGFEPFLTLSDSNSGFARARIQTARGDLAFFSDSGLSSAIPAMTIHNGSGDVSVIGNITGGPTTTVRCFGVSVSGNAVVTGSFTAQGHNVPQELSVLRADVNNLQTNSNTDNSRLNNIDQHIVNIQAQINALTQRVNEIERGTGQSLITLAARVTALENRG